MEISNITVHVFVYSVGRVSVSVVYVVLPEREQKMNRRFYDNLKDMEFDLLLQELLSYKA